MIPLEREMRIMDLLKTKGIARVEKLAKELGVSPATIRNDLSKMTEIGLVKRVHGGAMLVGMAPTAYEVPFSERKSSFNKEKQEIGKLAAKEISDGQTVIFDVSTTVLEVAKNIKTHNNLIVITNAIHIFMELRVIPQIQIILVGGILERNEMCLVGHIAFDTFEKFYADKAFIGAGGISLEKGITGFGISESEVRNKMIESAREVIIVADSSKIGKISLISTAPLNKIDKLITDWHAKPEQINQLQDQGIEVLICNQDSAQ
jgi:DeoR/GlpR family transcriptional regulator of sugar metabolism